jgi:glycosyltransferase involved in cell wall biosynthesis
LKILLVSDYASPGAGGAEVGLSILRHGLRTRGHDVRVFASTALASGDSFADYSCLGTTSRFRTLLQSANLSAAVRLRSVIGTFRPDVVHVNLFLTQLSPFILPVLRGVPAINHICWYRPICPTGLKLLPSGALCHESWGQACRWHACLPSRDWPVLMLQMQLLKRWRKIFKLNVAVSEAVAARLRQDGIGPVKIIPYGVPVVPTRPPLSEPPTVAYAGRFVREKGIGTLVRAFARARETCPEARLELLGDGPEWDTISRLVTELGIDDAVRMHGYLPRTAAEDMLVKAWVQVIPSIWEEPLPLSGLEAMMRGTALIASRIGGHPEMIRHGETGLLYPRDDEQALTDALTLLLGDRNLCEQVGQAARLVALECYTAERYTQQFVETYDQTMETK